MPQINTSLITSLPGDDIATRDLNFSNVGQAFNAGLARSDPLENLKRLNLEQDLQLRSFQISKTFEDRQRFLDAEQTAREIAPTLQGRLSNGNPSDAYQIMLDAMVRNPVLAESPTWNSLGNTVKTAMEIQDRAEDNRRQAARDKALEDRYSLSPAGLEAKNYADAKAALRTEQGKLTDLTKPTSTFGPPPPNAVDTGAIQEQRERIQSAQDVVEGMDARREKTEKFDQRLFRLTTERDAAIDSGDIELARRLQDQVNYIQSQHRNPRLEEQLRDIRGMRQATYSAMMKEKVGSSQYNALQAKMDELEADMRRLLSDGAALPAPASAPANKAFVFVPGVGVKPK